MTPNLAASIQARLLNRAKAFLNKNRLDAPPLDVVIEEVRRFVAEPMALARQKIASLRP